MLENVLFDVDPLPFRVDRAEKFHSEVVLLGWLVSRSLSLRTYLVYCCVAFLAIFASWMNETLQRASVLSDDARRSFEEKKESLLQEMIPRCFMNVRTDGTKLPIAGGRSRVGRGVLACIVKPHSH